MYMTTQRFRTPKGLAWIKERGKKLGIDNKNHILVLMTELRQIYSAVWMECVWMVADATKSDVKFIVSDHPITIYNRHFTLIF